MYSRYARRLLQLGYALFLLGLLTGLAMPLFANPRMGLSSHLEGVLNGIFLIGLGLVWSQLKLNPRLQALIFWLVLYGTLANWAATLFAAIWGAGSAMMPIAGQGLHGLPSQEIIIAGLLLSLSIAMVSVCGLVLWGLRGDRDSVTAESPIS